jgi:hypothetical protein
VERVTGTREPPEEVDDMAASRIIEEESGTSTAPAHSHNGYYAGDFSSRPVVQLSASREPSPTRPTPAMIGG